MKTRPRKKRVVMVDHYGSFTYILIGYMRLLGASVELLRTNASLKEVERCNPTHVVLSPGPGHPKEVVLFQETLERFKRQLPIFGVCLGHQAIGLHFGGAVGRCRTILHGETSLINHNGKGLFAGIDARKIEVCRYNSLAIAEKSFPSRSLQKTAWCDDGTIMGVASIEHPNVVGVQFHPESLFTEFGMEIVSNFLSM